MNGVDAGANPVGGTTVIGDLTVSGTASDGMSGLDRIVFAVHNYASGLTKLCGTLTNPGPSFAFEWTTCGSTGALGPESVQLRVTAYDKAGNPFLVYGPVERTYL